MPKCVLLIVIVAFALSRSNQVQAEDAPLNFVVVLVDDMGRRTDRTVSSTRWSDGLDPFPFPTRKHRHAEEEPDRVRWWPQKETVVPAQPVLDGA